MQKKIFIVIGHPDREPTLTNAAAGAYERGALEGGHQVRVQHIATMQFDPMLHRGYKVIQTLEPDLVTFQENVRWADHLVILYPNWWGTMPALLKGLIDRAWLPGFAFRFRKNGMGWEQLLRGKTARLIIFANTHPYLAGMLFGDFTNELRRATLGFAGISTSVSVFSPSEKAPRARVERWLKKIAALGRRAL